MDASQQSDNETVNLTSPSELETDLTDSPKDEKAMEDEEVVLDLPDVADIPGQENIVPPKMNMFADKTISSDGEEGTAVFDEDDDAEL